MPTNQFYNNFGASMEQRLYEDIVIESIRGFGIDLYYLPRDIHNFDKIYEADDISTFDEAIQIEMYVRSYEGFQGDGNLMSKFGLEIRDQVIFTCASRVFHDEVETVAGLLRPRESDLIYYPLDKKLFTITYVEKKVFHYPIGMLPVFDLHCELIEYSHEEIDTGIDEIDSIVDKLSLNELDYALLAEDGTPLYNEDGTLLLTEKFDVSSKDFLQDNSVLNQAANGILDWSESNPFSEEFKR
jgi:hypothetical protein